MSHAAIANIWARAGERFQSIITKYERIAEERNDSDDESIDLTQFDDEAYDDAPLKDAFERCHATAVRRPTIDDEDDALELEGNDDDGMLGYFSGRFLQETKSRAELDDPLEALEVDEDDEDDDEDVLLNCGVEDCLLCRAKAIMAQHKPMIVPQVKIEDDEKLRLRPVVILHRLMLPSTPEPLPSPDTPEEAIREVPEQAENTVDSEEEEEIQVVECRVRPKKVVLPAIDDRVKSAIRTTYQENRSADPDSFVEAVMRTILAAPTKDEPPSPVEVKNARVTVEAKHLAIVKQRLSPEVGPVRRRRIKQRVSPVPTERTPIVVKSEPNKAKTERKKGLPLAIPPYDSHDDCDDEEELENYFPYPSFTQAPEEEEEGSSRIASPKPEPKQTPTLTTSSKKRARSRRKPMLDWQKATLVEQKKSTSDAKRREKKKKKKKKEKIADDAISTKKNKQVDKTLYDDDDYFSKTFNLGDSPDTPAKSNQRRKDSRNCATEVKKSRPKSKTKQLRSIHIDFGSVRDESDDFFLSRFVED